MTQKNIRFSLSKSWFRMGHTTALERETLCFLPSSLLFKGLGENTVVANKESEKERTGTQENRQKRERERGCVTKEGKKNFAEYKIQQGT